MRALDREEPLSLPRAAPLHAVVPIGAPDATALRALGYARSLASHLTILQLPGEDAALTRRRLRRLPGRARPPRRNAGSAGRPCSRRRRGRRSAGADRGGPPSACRGGRRVAA